MKRKPNLQHLLNLGYMQWTNKTVTLGSDDLPSLYCNTDVYPDYLALYDEPGLYHSTRATGVCFYEYDSEMDGIRGLYEAIYHEDTALLRYYKDRFKGVRFFITPDYSECGDACSIDNKHRLFRSRLVGLWLTHELQAVVIPHVTFPLIKDIRYAITGLEHCSVVAFSTKGYVNNQHEQKVLIEAVKIVTDTLPLKAIVVYDTCGDSTAVDQMFSYSVERGIKIIVPNNTLKQRNRFRKEAQE